MNTRTAVSVAALTFVAGIAVGVAGARSNPFVRTPPPASISQQGASAKSANVRGLLAEVAGNPGSFILSGTSSGPGCDELVTATLHDDYMEVKLRYGLKYFVPYSAIYRIDRQGPGNVQVPVVYTTIKPQASFCGA